MVRVHYGRTSVDLDVDPRRQVPVTGVTPAALERPGEVVAAALEAPVDFPPLRRALTPADHVVLVVDARLPDLAGLVSVVLGHLGRAGVEPGSVTVVSAASAAGNESWVDGLPEEYEDVRLDTHDPTDRKKLSYLATTKAGRRVYLNRTLVEADQVVVLGQPDADGDAGGRGLRSLFPTLGGSETPDGKWAAAGRATGDADEVAWLLGVPFLVQVVPGAGDTIAAVVAGPPAAAAQGEAAYHRAWDRTVPRRAETVVAAVREPEGGSTFADLARALAHASRVVEPGGKIVLLTEARPALGPGAAVLKKAGDPERALALLARQDVPDREAAAQWAAAAGAARVYLLSRLPAAEAEEVLVTPLDDVGQTRRLIEGSGSWLVLEDADKALPRVADGGDGHG